MHLLTHYILPVIFIVLVIYFIGCFHILWRRIEANPAMLGMFKNNSPEKKALTNASVSVENTQTEEIKHNIELSHWLNQLQDAIKDGEDNEEFSELEINTGKFRILQGRLKALVKRLDAHSKGYLLSCLVNMGLSNNPFILEDLDFADAVCPDELFYEADLSRMVAHNINLTSSILSNARLENAKLSFARLSHCRMDDLVASSIYLNSAQMDSCYLKGADLRRSYLIDSNMKQCYLGECKLDGAIMRQADLTEANLSQSSLIAVNISEGILTKAIVKDSNLTNATLSEANLKSTYLTGSNLDAADLWRANLSGSILIGVNLQNAYLQEARFHGKFKDLSECKEYQLDQLQEQGIGLFSSSHDFRYDIEATNFAKTKWWLASFDAEALKSLGQYLIDNFAYPNGFENLNNDDLIEYEKSIKKFNIKSNN